MTFCSHCGQRLPDAAVACPGCGAPAGEREPALMADVEDLIRAGRKIEAIKAYREATGAPLKDAKDAVEAWERDARWSTRPSPRSELTADARELARAGRKIAAIKAYRDATGGSLKDAKEAVEVWMRDEGIVAPSGQGCATSVVLLCLLIVAGWLCGR